jgi:hypothetical protein
MHQMRLIVEVAIIGDPALPTAGPSELVIHGGVEPYDSSVEFRRHADLREETPLELSLRQPGIGRHYREAMNAVARKQAVRRNGDRAQRTVATEHTDEALFDELDSLGKARSLAKLMFEPPNLRVR